MRKKILSALLLGLFTVASTSTFVSCKDYDDDISNLQEQITQNNTDLKKLVDDKIAIVNAEIQKVNDALDAAEKACADADKKLQANIDAANKAITDGDAATLAAAKKAVEDAMVQVAATYATKAELQKAQSDLETAYKAADELIKKDVESNAKEIANLLEADKKLDAAVKAAQATADDALKLAQNIEKTYATKAELADEIKKVNDSLAGVKAELEGKIGDNLTKISALETRATKIETDVTANGKAIEALQKLTKEHTSTLEALGSHMNVVCDSLKTLDAAIASNAARIETVKDSLANAYTQAIEGATTTLNASISASNVRIDSLNGAVNDQISTINGTLETASNDIDSIGQVIDKVIERVGAIESRLAIINADLSNLITSIIYNGQSRSAVLFGKMDTNISGTFPYSGYKGNDSIALRGDSVLMTANGIVYATINPAEIDFAGTSVKLVNSQNNAHALFSLGNAEVVTESDPVLTITRATENFGNGLYKFQVKALKSGIKSEEFVGKNSVYAVAPTGTNDACIAYALQTTYKAGDSTRTVTSHYDVAIVPTKANEVNSIKILPVAPGTAANDSLIYELNDQATTISGEFKLDKTFENIYAAYVEIDTDAPGAKEKFKDVQLTIGGKPFGVLKGDSIAKNITITAPNNLINEAIPVKAYGLNYNGSIVTDTKKIVFTRSLFGAINVELVDTLNGSGDKVLDITKELIAKLREVKGDDAAKLFASNAVLPVDSVKNGIYRIHLEAATRVAGNDSVKNTFKYVPRGLTFTDGQSVITQKMEFKSATGLKVATVTYKLTVVLPTWYDNLNMRIAPSFGTIDPEDKDYTVGWAFKDQTNADTTKVAYLWDTHSFNIERFTDAMAAKDDTESYLTYDAKTGVAVNGFFDKNAAAVDSVLVTNLYVFSSDEVPAINTKPGADSNNTKFQLEQIVNYFGIAPKVIDTFNFSVASPINYGIYRGGAKKIEATVDNSGDATAPLTDFHWQDFSNNKADFDLSDRRIASVECKLIKDAANNYSLVTNKEIEVDRYSNRLTFHLENAAVTSSFKLIVDVVITDYWGIQTTLRGTITAKSFEGQLPTQNP